MTPEIDLVLVAANGQFWRTATYSFSALSGTLGSYLCFGQGYRPSNYNANLDQIWIWCQGKNEGYRITVQLATRAVGVILAEVGLHLWALTVLAVIQNEVTRRASVVAGAERKLQAIESAVAAPVAAAVTAVWHAPEATAVVVKVTEPLAIFRGLAARSVTRFVTSLCGWVWADGVNVDGLLAVVVQSLGNVAGVAVIVDHAWLWASGVLASESLESLPWQIVPVVDP
jgi:hypothetical protein